MKREPVTKEMIKERLGKVDDVKKREKYKQLLEDLGINT